MDIGDWLRSLGLEQYEAAFRDNAITGKVLPNLTADDLKDLYQTSVRLTRLGFPNHPQHDSRWQTEGRLPWGLRLRCGRTFRARNFVAWRRGLRTPLRRAGCLRSQQCSTVPRGKRRRRSAAWIGRPCGTG